MMISLNLNEYNIRLDSSSKILILNESNLSFVVVTNFVYQIKKCSDEHIGALSNAGYFTKPDAVEKIVCDQDCLAGILPSTTTTMSTKEILLLSTIQLSHEKETMKYLILFPLLVVLLVLLFSFLVCLIILKRKSNLY